MILNKSPGKSKVDRNAEDNSKTKNYNIYNYYSQDLDPAMSGIRLKYDQLNVNTWGKIEMTSIITNITF